MGLTRYTREQLLHLQNSPLVRKPDGLPDIVQWMEVQQPDQSNRKPRTQSGRGDETEDTGQRPLFPSRTSRQNITSAEDIVLGPPKMSFTSTAKGTSRFPENIAKDSDEHTNGRERRNFGDRFGRDRDNDRNRERNGYLGSRNAEDDGEGWQTARPRKSFGHEDGDRWQRDGDRNRERFQRTNDADRENRRNGGAKDRVDRRWTREDTPMATGEGESRDGERLGGWRDRDRNRPSDREWGRGVTGRFDSRAEEVPEWMDEPVNESKQAKNVNDFEAWKAQQKAKQAGKPDDLDIPTPSKPMEEQKATNAFGLSGKSLFGMYGESKKVEAEPLNGNATAKATAKAKASKFADFFSKEEATDIPQPEPAVSPPPAAAQSNEADKEGFNRILALLGKSNISSPPPPAGSAPPQQVLHRPPPEPRSPPFERQPTRGLSGLPEDPALQHGIPLQPHREQFGSPSQDFGPFPAIRSGAATAPNEKESAFRAPESQRKSQIDENHAFLLNLMQSRAPPPQQTPGPMSPSSDLNSSFVFPENKQSRQPLLQHDQLQQQQQQQQQQQLRLREEQQARDQQARMRGMPPGFSDERQGDRLMFEAEQQRLRGLDRSRPETGRKPSQRGGPPGFFDDQAVAALQRRQTDQSGRQPQQQLGQNLPRQMQQHAEEYIKMGLPPSMQRPPQSQDALGPPPGFGSGLPPGFSAGIPPGFGPPPPAGAPPPQGRPVQQQQPPQQRAQGIPGMFPHAHNMMPPPPGGPQGLPHGAAFFSPGSGAPPGFVRPSGNSNMPPPPPGMSLPPHMNQRPPFDMVAEMQHHPGGRGGLGQYGP